MSFPPNARTRSLPPLALIVSWSLVPLIRSRWFVPRIRSAAAADASTRQPSMASVATMVEARNPIMLVFPPGWTYSSFTRLRARGARDSRAPRRLPGAEVLLGGLPLGGVPLRGLLLVFFFVFL